MNVGLSTLASTMTLSWCYFFFFFQAEDGIRDDLVTGVQTCALPIFERSPFLDEGPTPILRRAFNHARRIGNYALVQATVQLIAFSSGILLVRWLPQHEYAFYTIANAMQAALMLLADIGISVGLVSIGGRVWQDRYRFGELINTGLAVRRKLAAASVIIVAPILYAMLTKNGASSVYTLLLIAFVLAGFSIQLSVDVFSVVPRLHSDIGRIQKIDFICAIFRLLLILGLVYFFATAGLAVAIASAAFLLQYFLLRAYAAKIVDLKANENADDRREIVRLIKKLAANSLFYCFQGQITVFLISFFGRHAASVAEVDRKSTRLNSSHQIISYAVFCLK